MISPFVIVALIILTMSLYIEFKNYELIEEDTEKEIELDIKNHKKVLNEIAGIAKAEKEVYYCAEYYTCYNVSYFEEEVYNCTGQEIVYNGSFYLMYHNQLFKLNLRYLGCEYGQNKEVGGGNRSNEEKYRFA